MIQDPMVQQNTKAPWPVITSDNVERIFVDGPKIRVRVIHPKGLTYFIYRFREGDVFDLCPFETTVVDPNTGQPVIENGKPKKKILSAEEQFSSRTMERVDASEPVKITTAQESLNKSTEELKAESAPIAGRRRQ